MHTIPFENYESLLFDLDGTIADSMALHNQAWITTLAQMGCSMTVEILREYAGIPNLKTVEIFNKRFGWDLDPQAISNYKESLFIQNLKNVRVIEPVLNIAFKYKLTKPFAIVSGGSRDLVEQILKVLQIENLFPIRVCANDVINPKPHPEPFLLAARLLNVHPNKCLVFEDGEAGIESAKKAGMGIVKVTSDFSLQFLNLSK